MLTTRKTSAGDTEITQRQASKATDMKRGALGWMVREGFQMKTQDS